MPQPSLLFVLCERAGLQPDDSAFTYTDYELDWAGAPESLTWARLEHYRGEQFIRWDA